MTDLPRLRAVREGRVGETVILHITTEEGEERLTLSRRAYEALGAPAVGTSLEDAFMTRARHMADYRATYATALHILESGDTTASVLRDKLRRRGHEEDNIERVLAEMVKRGYINETRLAARQVVLCAEKGWGRRRIFAYLASRGIDEEVISQAIAEAENNGEVDFAALRRAFIAARRARGMSEEAIKRALWNAGH